MKVFKRLSRWWSKTHGGEWEAHADFVLEEGETLGNAFHDLFFLNPDEFWQRPVGGGRTRKVHMHISFHDEADPPLISPWATVPDEARLRGDS